MDNNENIVVKTKKSKKGLIVFLIILGVLVLLSIPTKIKLKDGGTIVYKSVTWEYRKVHSMNIKGYDEGEILKICGIEIINNVKENAELYSTKSKKDNNTTNTNSYTTFINNIKVRKNAESVGFRNVSGEPNGYKTFILGTDNKIYKETYDDGDTKIPGAIGSGGEYTGKYIGIDKVVRIFKTYHSPVDGGASDGLLVLREDGSLYIIRSIETNEYKLEELEYKNIVTAFDTITGQGTTYVVDISGNQYAIK